MCGIAGFVLKTEHSVQDSLINQMTDCIAHRGPDDEGFYRSVDGQGAYNIALGHRRLSIIDLGSGHQPMSNSQGTVHVVFNGEIYNFEELRYQLVALGYNFTTHSDTEVIIYAYEAYGYNCVDHFQGMFALALWDEAKQALFIARDRYGKKPLYFHQCSNGLIFGSEIKSILQYKDYDRSVSRDAIWHYLSFRYVPSPLTLFEGIEKLQQGCCAEWKDGHIRQWSYYSPPDCQSALIQYSGPDPVNTFLEELEKSVKIRMVSDVPFGAFFSGGIDSSAVVGLMSRHSYR